MIALLRYLEVQLGAHHGVPHVNDGATDVARVVNVAHENGIGLQRQRDDRSRERERENKLE